MICANMQTSFMHPPFGFALFYLRGIAPQERSRPATSIWGAIPWLVLQLILVAILIAFPELVTFFLDARERQDLDTVQVPGGPGSDLSTPPEFGAPAGSGRRHAACAAGQRFVQPPSFN